MTGPIGKLVAPVPGWWKYAAVYSRIVTGGIRTYADRVWVLEACR